MSGTLCILDDDDAVRDSLRVLLEAYDYDVVDFAFCKDILDWDEIGGCACLIVDFHMPEMNGLELLEALRGQGVTAPALIVSALSVDASADRLARAGVMARLTKPVAEPELIAWIQRAFDAGSAAPQ